MFTAIGLLIFVSILPANTLLHRARRGRWDWTYEEQFKIN